MPSSVAPTHDNLLFIFCELQYRKNGNLLVKENIFLNFLNLLHVATNLVLSQSREIQNANQTELSTSSNF